MKMQKNAEERKKAEKTSKSGIFPLKAEEMATLTAIGTLPPRKKLFVNRNSRLHDLENRYKQQTLTLEEYLEKVMKLIGIKKF